LASKLVATVFSGLASKPVATVSPCLASKLVVDFLFDTQNQGGGGFPGLGLKTSSYGSVIWASKSPRQFFGLGLKTQWAMVCRLCLKITAAVFWFRPQNQVGDGLSVVPQNRREDETAPGTRQDLATCFVWKQVGIGFPSLTSTLVEARRRVVHVAPSQRLCHVQSKIGRVDATGCIRPFYPESPFSIYWALGT
jgi:hypothetical protein